MDRATTGLTCLLAVQILATTADTLKNFAVIYLVDLSEIPDFNTMYELYDPCTVMFFFRNKHIMIDLGTGNNNKINWAMNNKQEFIDIVEVVYRGARKGRGLVVSPKGALHHLVPVFPVPSAGMLPSLPLTHDVHADYSTKYRY